MPANDRADGEAGLSTVRLSDFGLRREPPRPPSDRPGDYERLFDADTLFYDVFQSAERDAVICLGPPLLNCEAALGQAVFRVAGSDEPIRSTYRAPRSPQQPTCQFRLTGAGLATADRLVMAQGGRALEVPIRRSGGDRFAGRRVIVTLSRDNPLVWIRDWAEFNVRVHGADAVLLYDNGSTSYDLDAIRASLEGLPGLAAVAVVPWRFPYGPGVGRLNIQDSFYCQPGAIEHARWRYCTKARGVLNTDIDELVVSPSGASIFERAEASGRAAILFRGLWVERPTPPSENHVDARHSDCVYGERRQAILRRSRLFRRLLRTKWIVLPERCPGDVDWGVHDLYPSQPQTRAQSRSWKVLAHDVFYRHFRQINTGWKIPRWMGRRHSFFRHVYDSELARMLALAFPERRIARRSRWRSG